EDALFLGDEQRRGIRQRNEAELGALHFGPGTLRERAGGEIQLGSGEQRGRTARGLEQLATAEAGGLVRALGHWSCRPLRRCVELASVCRGLSDDAGARRRVLGRPQNGGGSIRMEWSRGTAAMASPPTIQAVCQPCRSAI